MTRDEAIAIIRKEYLCVDRDCGIEKNCGKCDLVMPSKEPILEAFKMAIRALEQEPCGDCISRKAAIDQTYIFSKDEFLRVTNPFYYLRKRIKSLPPVTPQPEIIRCKDCKEFRHRWINTDITFCNRTDSEVKEDDFCSRAERRTDG